MAGGLDLRANGVEGIDGDGPALEAELTEVAGEGVRQLRPLPERGQDGPALAVHEGGLFQEPGIQAVHVEAGPDGQLHQGPLLGARGILAAQVGQEVLPPVQEGPSRRRPPVNRLEPPDLHPSLQGIQAVPRVGSWGLPGGPRTIPGR